MDYIQNIISKADNFAERYLNDMKTQDKEIAMSLYNQMYEMQMISKKYTEAGNIAFKAAKMLEIVDDNIETIELYRKSAQAYIKTNDYDRAIDIYKTIIFRYEKGILHNPIAYYLENLADLYEQELQDQEAITTYLKSCEQYNMINKPYNVIKILNKVAKLYIYQENIFAAKDTYFNIINICIKNNIHMFLFYDYLFTLYLCEFNIYVKNNETKIDEFLNKINIYSGFNETAEYLLLSKCIDAFSNKDENQFTQTINEYSSLNKLDSIQIFLLDQIKKLLPIYDI